MGSTALRPSQALAGLQTAANTRTAASATPKPITVIAKGSYAGSLNMASVSEPRHPLPSGQYNELLHEKLRVCEYAPHQRAPSVLATVSNKLLIVWKSFADSGLASEPPVRRSGSKTVANFGRRDRRNITRLLAAVCRYAPTLRTGGYVSTSGVLDTTLRSAWALQVTSMALAITCVNCGPNTATRIKRSTTPRADPARDLDRPSHGKFRKALKSNTPPQACASCGLRWSL